MNTKRLFCHNRRFPRVWTRVVILPLTVAMMALDEEPLPAKTAAPPAGQTVELREIGALTITPRFYGSEPQRSSWITMEAADSAKAKTCASKYLEDILGFGEVKSATDATISATLLSLEGTGWWVLGLEGAKFHIVFARSKDELTGLLKKANAANWRAVERASYPKWLDCFDNSAVSFWFSGFGIQPTDIPADFKWYADNQFAFCTPVGNSEYRLIAPGVVDTSVMDWYSAMAAKYRIPYKMMAEMATPARSESLWNYAPLPHFVPIDGQIAANSLYYQKLAMHATFQPDAATDSAMMDFRRRVGERFKGDPYFMGHHVMQEMPPGAGDILELAAIAGTPEVKMLWTTYLRDVLKLDLKAVGKRYCDDTSAYRSWADVQIPPVKELVGWESSAIDLKGTWEGRADREKKAASEKWTEDASPSDKWTPVDSQDLGIMSYGGGQHCDYWLRRKFSVSSGSSPKQFLHMAYVPNSPICDVWMNGHKLKLVSSVDPSSPGWDMCFETVGAIKSGENLIVMNVKGMPIPSYIFIGAKGKWVYPGPSETINRRYFDSIQFDEWLMMRELENRMIAIRAGDPNRPMKIMAPHNSMDLVLDLCARYGAYPHDTGGAAAWFGPFTYSRYAFTRGIPNSAEEGGIPSNAFEMRAAITRYLMMGVDMIDNVGHVDRYSKDAGRGPWIAENRELLRCIGKLDLIPPAIGLLRSGRELRLGISELYQWDLGRGGLPGLGRGYSYAELGDLKSGRANKFRVLIDCATTVMTEAEVDALEKYVRQGGIFVAFHNTGMHTPEKAYSWPISRLTGLRVLNDSRPIGGSKIRFSDTQTLWPNLRGRELNGWGLVLDWKKQDRTGTPIGLAAQDKDIEVVAEWQGVKMEGNIAAACRKLGKGKVITLGSTFWRTARDEGGRYDEAGSLPYLDELLTSIGVPHEATAGDLMAELWRSKNGVYDVYPVAQLNQNAAPVTTDVKIHRDTPVTALWEMSALKHPSRPVQYANGLITIPQVTMEPMQSRVYAAPRADVENAPLYWLHVQKRQWSKLPKISLADKQRATVKPAGDVISLIEGWQCSTGEKDPSWLAPNAVAKDWKSVRLGSFAAMGLPEETVAQFRKEVKLPADSINQRVMLFFDAEGGGWGIGPSGQLWINGEPAAIKQPLRPSGDSSFVIELTPKQVKQQVLSIALEVDARPQTKNQAKARPCGVTGSFFLRITPQPVQVTALEQWTKATDLNVLAATEVGQPVECMYLETRFTLPAHWPAKRLYLKSPVCLGGLFINNQYVASPKWMQELDVSGLVKRDGENILRWTPERSEPTWRSPYKGKVPELNLVWLP